MAEVLSDAELMRYSRQILLDGWDIDAQLKLKNSKVLIVGAGGLGCPVSQILVRAGVGYVHLLDFDVIDDSNLQRQTLFDADDVGKPKAQVACQKLKVQNEWVAVDFTHERLSASNIDGFLAHITPDLVIDCTDNFAVRDLLNQGCRKHQLPLLSNSAIGEVGQIALFTADTGCYHCLFGDEAGDERTCATSGVLASTVATIGAMTAQVALDFLGREHNPIAGELLLWQGRTLSLRKVKFNKDEHCPVCR